MSAARSSAAQLARGSAGCPDADRPGQRQRTDLAAQPHTDLVPRAFEAGRATPGHHDGELVASASAEQGLWPDQLVQLLGDPDQDSVTGRVTQLVVDRLEAVDVQAQHAQPRGSRHTGQHCVETHRAAPSVQQAGEVVAAGVLGGHLGEDRDLGATAVHQRLPREAEQHGEADADQQQRQVGRGQPAGARPAGDADQSDAARRQQPGSGGEDGTGADDDEHDEGEMQR